MDLELDKLTHQDLGQMHMYVNDFDRYVETPDEARTIGILLCQLAPLIDVLHRAASLWAAGARQELADFLVAALPPGGTERMQRLAQSIVDVLPPGDKERALYENFLVGARSLPVPTKQIETANPQMRLF